MAFPAFFGFFLLAVAVSAQNIEITPSSVVKRVGEEVTIMCRVNYMIDTCQFKIGNDFFLLKNTSNNGDVQYAGAGLQIPGRGECGARIRNIRPEWAGPVQCQLPNEQGTRLDVANMTLVVAQAPAALELLTPTPPPTGWAEGDAFAAQCVSRGGRPHANLSWFLAGPQGEEELQQGVHMARVELEGALEAVSQNLSRLLSADDDGRRLRCQADHLALARPQSASAQLLVLFPPKVESRAVTIFGLKLGEEGRLNVTVRANPPPLATWIVGGVTVRAGLASDDRSLLALQPEPLGAGYYNVTLVVAALAKEDVEREYVLEVSNGRGQERVSLRISTMDEPAVWRASFLVIDVYGLELEAGAIVGIVVGVLALLLAVFLIVFAKATHRWCFAGENRGKDTKNAGETTPAGDVLLQSVVAEHPKTSETESAAGMVRGARQRASARLAALGGRLRGALPRGTRSQARVADTVGDETDKPLPEEKKGVVYAELALSDPPAPADKPAPHTEYAEILYAEKETPRKE